MQQTIIDIKKLTVKEDYVIIMNTRGQWVLLEPDLRDWALHVNKFLKTSFPLRVVFTQINNKNYANCI